MTSIVIDLPTPATTRDFGRRLGETARPGDIFTLAGPLGAGKTTLTQAIGQGILVPQSDYITSPTFSLLHEYQGRIPLYHLDLYRLEDENEIEELGFLDYIYGNGLTVIEWPDRLGGLMPENRLHIKIEPVSETDRRIALAEFGTTHLIETIIN